MKKILFLGITALSGSLLVGCGETPISSTEIPKVQSPISDSNFKGFIGRPEDVDEFKKQADSEYIQQLIKDGDKETAKILSAIAGLGDTKNALRIMQYNPSAFQSILDSKGITNLSLQNTQISSQSVDDNCPARLPPGFYPHARHLMYNVVDVFGRPFLASKAYPPTGVKATNDDCRRTVGNIFSGTSVSGYQGGHLMAYAVGGYPGRSNLAPQVGNFNGGVWRETEKYVRGCKNMKWGDVDIETKLKYPINPFNLIPDTWRMEVKVKNNHVNPPISAYAEAEYKNEIRGGTSGPKTLKDFRDILDDVGCGRQGVGLVVDDTGSMSSLLWAVKIALIRYIESWPEIEDDEDPTKRVFTLTTFKDDVSFRGKTESKNDIKQWVNNITADGGEDCQENAYGALQSAINSFSSDKYFKNAPKSLILVTDATSKYGDPASLVESAKRNGTKINIMQTGLCLPQRSLTSGQSPQSSTAGLKNQSLEGDDLLRSIAEQTGGLYIYDPSGDSESYVKNLNLIFDNAETPDTDKRPSLSLDELIAFTKTQKFSSALVKGTALLKLEAVKLSISNSDYASAKLFLNGFITIIEIDAELTKNYLHSNFMIDSANKIISNLSD